MQPTSRMASYVLHLHTDMTLQLFLTVNEGFGVVGADVVLLLDPGLFFDEGAIVLLAALSLLGEYRAHAELEQRLSVRQRRHPRLHRRRRVGQRRRRRLHRRRRQGTGSPLGLDH